MKTGYYYTPEGMAFIRPKKMVLKKGSLADMLNELQVKFNAELQQVMKPYLTDQQLESGSLTLDIALHNIPVASMPKDSTNVQREYNRKFYLCYYNNTNSRVNMTSLDKQKRSPEAEEKIKIRKILTNEFLVIGTSADNIIKKVPFEELKLAIEHLRLKSYINVPVKKSKLAIDYFNTKYELNKLEL